MEKEIVKDLVEVAKTHIIYFCEYFGYDILLDELRNSDFFTAPASTKYHGNFEGGLALHCYNVFEELYKILEDRLYINAKEVAFKLAICHDLCKIGVYKIDYRNVKNENGEWVKAPYYLFDDTFPYGHGEKSVQTAELLDVPLNPQEKMAIRWHMGEFDTSVKGGFNISNVFNKWHLAVYLHIADMLATYTKDITL